MNILLFAIYFGIEENYFHGWSGGGVSIQKPHLTTVTGASSIRVATDRHIKYVSR